MKDSSICLMDVDEACKEAGINRHILRFTSTVKLEDPGPTARTAEKLYQLIQGQLPDWSVLVKIEGEDDGQKSVFVSWTNQDEDLGSYILGLLSRMGQ